MNLKHLKPTDVDWTKAHIEAMGKSEFYDYVNKIFAALDRVHQGGEYKIVDRVAPEKYDIFIKTACWWMDISPDYYFTEDYSIIKREEYVDPTKWHRGKQKDERDLDNGGEFFIAGESRKTNNSGSGKVT